MTATAALYPTVAARVPPERKQALYAFADEDGVPASELLNTALAEYLERRRNGRDVARMEAEENLRRPREGTTRRHDRGTTKRAAEYAAPRTGTGRRRALVIIASRPNGATTDEVLEALERRAAGRGERPPAQNSVARRVTDLLEAGAIEEATEVYAPESFSDGRTIARASDLPRRTVTRPTRHGAAATVWTVTAKGREWVDAVTEPER